MKKNPHYDDIKMFIHCDKCMKELPLGKSMAEWCDITCGFDNEGTMIVWCKRHDILISGFRPSNAAELSKMKCGCGNPDCSGEGGNDALFELGNVVMSREVDLLTKPEEAEELRMWTATCLARHASGDCGDMTPDDQIANFEAIMAGKGMARIFSSYKNSKLSGGKLWIITEADRSLTTLLLPDEY